MAEDRITLSDENHALWFGGIDGNQRLAFDSTWEAEQALTRMLELVQEYDREHPCCYLEHPGSYEYGPPEYCSESAVIGEDYCEKHLAEVDETYDREDYEYDQYKDSLIDAALEREGLI